MISALNFPLSLFLSIVLVPVLMRYATLLGLIDRPDGTRKIHTRIIPKSGGLAIALATVIPVVYSLGQLEELFGLLCGALIIVVSGLLDDKYDLNYKWKFLGQILAVLVFLIFTPGLTEKFAVHYAAIPSWIVYTFLFIFLVGVSNAINLSDGLDGLAGGITLISLGLIAVLANEAETGSVFIVALSTMGALMGFLRYNTHPAQVFMGDTGSQFIGFTCATLSVYLSQSSHSAISPVLPLLILGVPIMDTLMVMSVRIYSGKSPFYPDKNHVHHQLMKFGFRHYEAVAILYLIQISLILMAYLLRYQGEVTLIIFYCCFAGTILCLLWYANRFCWRVRPNETDSTDFFDRRNPFFRSMSGFYEHSAGIVAVLFCIALVILIVATLSFHIIVMKLALLLLVVAFLLGIFIPRLKYSTTRILAYSATVLLLYTFAVVKDSSHAGFWLNVVLYFMGGCVLLAIRVTRKQQFQLNNQDLMILFMLLLGPLLPFEGDDGLRIGVMIFRMAVMIYAVEFILNKSQKLNFVIRLVSALSLFSICFIR